MSYLFYIGIWGTTNTAIMPTYFIHLENALKRANGELFCIFICDLFDLFKFSL